VYTSNRSSFITCTFTKLFDGDEIKGHEIIGAYNSHGTYVNKSESENLKRSDHLAGSDVAG
jgi:hypothetical protein